MVYNDAVVFVIVNPNDIVKKKSLDLHFDIQFDGIDSVLFQAKKELLHGSVNGELGMGHLPTGIAFISLSPSLLSLPPFLRFQDQG